MNILIAGGAGFIGSALTAHLRSQGHTVTILDRKPPRDHNLPYHEVDLTKPLPDPALLDGHEAVVNLTGAPINQRWNEQIKQEIYDSRVGTTRTLVDALQRLDEPPAVFVCASAIGYYGDRGEEHLPESVPPGTDFMAHVCRDWEAAAAVASESGIRTVSIRTAPVLGTNSFFLKELLPFYRLGLGGPLGLGAQWFAWVHLADLLAIYTLAITDERLRGPVNATAPHPLRQREFAAALGRALHRPAVIPTPRFAVRLLYGELADSLFVSQRIEPTVLKARDYTWRQPDLAAALAQSLKKG